MIVIGNITLTQREMSFRMHMTWRWKRQRRCLDGTRIGTTIDGMEKCNQVSRETGHMEKERRKLTCTI